MKDPGAKSSGARSSGKESSGNENSGKESSGKESSGKQGFAIFWSAEHLRRDCEITYAVGNDEKERIVERILSRYDEAEIRSVKAISADRARWITQRNGEGETPNREEREDDHL